MTCPYPQFKNSRHIFEINHIYPLILLVGLACSPSPRVCDDATSGYLAGFCADHAEKIDAKARQAKHLQTYLTLKRIKELEEFIE